MLLGGGDPVSWIFWVIHISEALPHPHKPPVEFEILVFCFPNWSSRDSSYVHIFVRLSVLIFWFRTRKKKVSSSNRNAPPCWHL